MVSYPWGADIHGLDYYIWLDSHAYDGLWFSALYLRIQLITNKPQEVSFLLYLFFPFIPLLSYFSNYAYCLSYVWGEMNLKNETHSYID